jgi:hypothetical protein
MDKKIAALLGAAAAVATVGGAQATTQPNPNSSEGLQAPSYAALLAPVPNAVAELRADNTARAKMPVEANVKLAQNHHHHHNTVIIKKRGRAHHHHHHHGAFIGVPGVGGVTVGSGQHHHHHHHDYNHD